jgi:hypothetical protein
VWRAPWQLIRSRGCRSSQRLRSEGVVVNKTTARAVCDLDRLSLPKRDVRMARSIQVLVPLCIWIGGRYAQCVDRLTSRGVGTPPAGRATSRAASQPALTTLHSPVGGARVGALRTCVRACDQIIRRQAQLEREGTS